MSAAALFLHSTGTGPFMWMGVPDSVLQGERMLTPPHIGYPPRPPLPRGVYSSVAEDVQAVLDAIPPDVDSIRLFAHSYGGLVAFSVMQALGARLKSVWLYEPVLFGALLNAPDADPSALAETRALLDEPMLKDERRAGTDDWLKAFVDYWNRPGTYARLPEASKAYNRELGWKMFQEVRACFVGLTAFPPLPEVPVTLVMGSRSPAPSRAMIAALAQRHPHARVVTLDKVGHMGPMTHPEQVYATMI